CAMYGLTKYFTRYRRGNAVPSSAAKVNWNDVIVITLSEFGRTTVQNSSAGTDHAEAGVMFIDGGSVNGYNKNRPHSGVLGCSPADSFNGHTIPWATGLNGSMFGAGGYYLQRA